jgi:hypothetical protein
VTTPLPLVRVVEAPKFMDIGGIRHETREQAHDASIRALVLESVRSGYLDWWHSTSNKTIEQLIAARVCKDFILTPKNRQVDPTT